MEVKPTSEAVGLGGVIFYVPRDNSCYHETSMLAIITTLVAKHVKDTYVIITVWNLCGVAEPYGPTVFDTHKI